MASTKDETIKRIKIAKDFANSMQNLVEGVILIGSVAYAPNSNVREDSDIDLIAVYQDVKDSVPIYFKNKEEQDYLLSRNFDGYLVKRKTDNIPVSIHNISYSALQKIVSGNYEALDYYRQSAKDTTYHSIDFDGIKHEFNVVSRKTEGHPGVVRTDPVAFESDGKYVIGNDMDKLLSKAEILYDKDNKIKFSLNVLWNNVARRLIEHRIKYGQDINVCSENISSILFRKDRMPIEAHLELQKKTQEYLNRLIG